MLLLAWRLLPSRVACLVTSLLESWEHRPSALVLYPILLYGCYLFSGIHVALNQNLTDMRAVYKLQCSAVYSDSFFQKEKNDLMDHRSHHVINMIICWCS